MSTPKPPSPFQYKLITVIVKRVRSYHCYQVIVPLTAPPTIAMRSLRLGLSDEGLLKDQWYHLNVFSVVTVEIARFSASSFQDIEANSPNNIVFLESSTPCPELTAALRNPDHAPNVSTVNLLGRFVRSTLPPVEGTGLHREALLIRRRTTISVGYATHDVNAGLTALGVFVAIVAALETFLIWASKHKFL
ncbi:hypothetical protein HYFRA_00013809 [Hymenoscyphus fraxineus]|uniref:Uncharacterized protein n=1 Tax=Hymenoscyphus fraxineus TaxID=746836 RepID=A0A9N9LBA1_9HELO|nr:hypothetical protein HYFRA_00013809 [Hymenoscyphus fraxineus]